MYCQALCWTRYFFVVSLLFCMHFFKFCHILICFIVLICVDMFVFVSVHPSQQVDEDISNRLINITIYNNTYKTMLEGFLVKKFPRNKAFVRKEISALYMQFVFCFNMLTLEIVGGFKFLYLQ